MGRADSQRNGRVLVLGAGVAGAAVAERLGRVGVEVHLIEKAPEIGGRVRQMGCKATDVCLRCGVCVADAILRAVPTLPTVHVRVATQLAAFGPGDDGRRFRAWLQSAGDPARQALDVDAVVVATGYVPYDPAEQAVWGYGRTLNVITSVDAERQLAERQRLTRPSDGIVPQRVAFVQCVGSRTEQIYRRPEDTNYCSTVCCAYALRIAQRLKHESPQTEITVFHMDLQNFGQGFTEFYADCRGKMRFVRARPDGLRPGPNGSVLVKYAVSGGEAGNGGVREEAFDLAILAVGIRPAPENEALAALLGVPLDGQGFFGLKSAAALPDLQREGIFVAGASESPKDIAGTLVQAEAVCAEVLALLGWPAVAGGAPSARVKPARKEVVVLGGGVAGLQAAQSLARLGHPVVLVHTDEQLGGTAAALPELYGHLGDDPEQSLASLQAELRQGLASVEQHELIRVYRGARVRQVAGELGDFRVTVATANSTEELHAGALVLGTGTPVKAAAGVRGAWVVGFEGLMAAVRARTVPHRVAIVLDLGVEDGRATSAQALAAAELLVRRFAAHVSVYCHHVRVAATGLENLYRRARAAGVVFVRYDTEPALSAREGRLAISAVDVVAGVTLTEEFDLAVLPAQAAGRMPPGVPVDGLRPGLQGALQYDNVWLLPTLTNRPGVFVVGGARGNSDYAAAVGDGLAVAAAVHAALGRGAVEVREDAATVNADECVLCLTCLRVCPHGAVTVDHAKEAASISPVVCRRCGMCAAECPARAITLPGHTDEETLAAIGERPRLTIFACENSALPAAEAARRRGIGSGVELIPVPCAGKVDPRSVLAALERGAERVLILGCHPESCQYLTGATRATRRMARLAELLQRAGFDASRVAFRSLAAVELVRFAEYVKPRGG